MGPTALRKIHALCKLNSASCTVGRFCSPVLSPLKAQENHLPMSRIYVFLRYPLTHSALGQGAKRGGSFAHDRFP